MLVEELRQVRCKGEGEEGGGTVLMEELQQVSRKGEGGVPWWVWLGYVFGLVVFVDVVFCRWDEV